MFLIYTGFFLIREKHNTFNKLIIYIINVDEFGVYKYFFEISQESD